MTSISSSVANIAGDQMRAGSVAKAVQARRLAKQHKDVSPEEKKAIKKLSEEFEAMFLNLVLKSMRDTVPKNKLVDGGNAEDIYRSMLDSEYAKQLSHQRGAGIADAVERQMLGIQQKIAKSTNDLQGNKAYASESLRFDSKKAKIELGL